VRRRAYSTSTISLSGMSYLRATAKRFEARADHRECNLTHFLVAAGHGLKDTLEQLPRERRVLGQLTVELSGQIVRSHSVLHAVIECPHP
jgi:hypothetical protein